MIGRRAEHNRGINQEAFHQQAQTAPRSGSQFNQSGELKEEYLEKLSESSLNEGTASMLGNLLSRDFVFGYMESAEVNEIRWLARNLQLKVEDMHPRSESDFTGTYRKVVADEARQTLEPLDDAQRAEMFTFIMGVIARASRSKDGWQQDKFTESVNVSEVRDNQSDSGGGWL